MAITNLVINTAATVAHTALSASGTVTFAPTDFTRFRLAFLSTAAGSLNFIPGVDPPARYATYGTVVMTVAGGSAIYDIPLQMARFTNNGTITCVSTVGAAGTFLATQYPPQI